MNICIIFNILTNIRKTNAVLRDYTIVYIYIKNLIRLGLFGRRNSSKVNKMISKEKL